MRGSLHLGSSFGRGFDRAEPAERKVPAMFKESALGNLFLTFAPFAIGFLMAIFLPGAMKDPGGYAQAAMVLYGIGFASFAAAKIQNILKGHLVTFGSALMSKPAKWAYRGARHPKRIFGLNLSLKTSLHAWDWKKYTITHWDTQTIRQWDRFFLFVTHLHLLNPMDCFPHFRAFRANGILWRQARDNTELRSR